MRRVLAAAALLLAAPASAAAAPFGELPFRPAGGPAVCLQATGAPGELVRWTPSGAELLQVRSDGLATVASIPLGRSPACPVVASDPSGAAVIATTSGRRLRLAVREPGGAFGAPVSISSPGEFSSVLAAAVSARGDAVVVWSEQSVRPLRTRLRVVRRAAGAALGTPELVVDAKVLLDDVDVAVTGAGEAVLALGGDDELRLATARPGAPFTRPRRIAGVSRGEVAVAANPDGRVLLAAEGSAGLSVFEREPGGELVRRPAIRGLGAFSALALALRPDGGAVIATQDGGPGSAVVAALRNGVTGFGAPIEVGADEQSPRMGSGVSAVYIGGGVPLEDVGELRAALGDDGRALLAWGTDGAGARIATVTSAGVTERQSLGGPVRNATGLTPLLLPSGVRAVAWTDNNGLFSAPPYAGRLHVAFEGVAGAPAPPLPELEVGAPPDRSLRPSQPLELPLRCSAACDVRGQIGDDNVVTASLPAAGARTLRIAPLSEAIAPRRPGSVRIALSWSAPGGRQAGKRTVSVRLRRLPAPPLPRIENLRARRRPGGIVDVRWRIDVPARDAYFVVYGTRADSLRRDPAPATGFAAGGPKRRSFHVRLRDAADARYVHVTVIQLPGGANRMASIRLDQ